MGKEINKIINIILLLCAVVVMASCGGDDEEEKVDPRNVYHEAEHTVLIYMAAENALSSFVKEDLKEMKAGSRSIGDNNLVVYVDRSYKNELPWLARLKDGQVIDSVSIADMGIANGDVYSSDPRVFEDVIRYAFNHYKATKGYGLVLWGHSSGWMIEQEITTTRAYGVDNGKNDGSNEGYWINIPIIKKVLEGLPHLDFIFADCCNFMCLESLYELRTVTDYIAGSPAEIPARGAPYDKVMPYLFSDDVEQGMLQVMEIYGKDNQSYQPYLPLSVVKTSKMDDVAAATRTALQEVTASLGGEYADMTGIIHYYYLGDIDKKFNAGYNIYYDAGDFMLKHTSESTYAMWKEALDQAVIGKRFASSWMSIKTWNVYFADFTATTQKYHGVSMFVPQDPDKGAGYNKYNEDIKQLEWYDTVWK